MSLGHQKHQEKFRKVRSGGWEQPPHCRMKASPPDALPPSQALNLGRSQGSLYLVKRERGETTNSFQEKKSTDLASFLKRVQSHPWEAEADLP